ncbi:MAG: TVP38/TMEM64 family protein [Actinomycetota bacterium]|nr:TVP38/TMEM64 family protein [Actinomycetota bacterium]
MSGTHRPGAGFTPWLRTAVTVALLAVLLFLYLVSDVFRQEVNWAVGVMGSADTGALRDYILSYGAWAPVVSAALMILQALAAFVPSFLLGLANGLAFGAFWGGMLSLVSAALAASISFGIARAVGRVPVEAIVGRESLGHADGWFERYGAYAVLVARLIPVVSFDAISYAAGLTKIGFWRFLGATTVGMAPATFVYSYLGERAPRFAGVLLVVFGIFVAAAVVAAVVRRRRRAKSV